MSIYTWSSPQSSSPLANFNALFAGVPIGLVAGGLLQSAGDTGQINFSTNTSYPSGASQSIGYQIWEFQDALQATTPIFIKLEFGSGASGAAYGGMWITVGKGSDGSGNITGIIQARTAIPSNNTSGSSYSNFVSAGTNRFVIFLGTTNTNGEFLIALERNHSTSGADTTDGLLLFWFYGNFTCGSQYISYAGTNPAAMAKWNVAVVPSGSGSLTPNINVFPVRCWTPGESGASLQLMAYLAGDLATNVIYSMTGWDGNVHNFLTTPGTSYSNMGYGGGHYPIFRYD